MRPSASKAPNLSKDLKKISTISGGGAALQFQQIVTLQANAPCEEGYRMLHVLRIEYWVLLPHLCNAHI